LGLPLRNLHDLGGGLDRVTVVGEDCAGGVVDVVDLADASGEFDARDGAREGCVRSGDLRSHDETCFLRSAGEACPPDDMATSSGQGWAYAQTGSTGRPRMMPWARSLPHCRPTSP